MKKIFLKSLFLTVITLGVFSVFAYVFAQPDLGLEYGAQTGLGSQDIRITIANIIRVALGLLGIVALVIVLWGGFMWMTAGGDENRVATAKKILFNGLIGLTIMLSSYAITSFIISRLVQATTGQFYPDHCYNGVLDLNLGETGRDCGGPCPTCSGDTPFNPYGSGNFFKIKSVPLGGQLCVANYHPVITFNYPVNLETVQGKIRVLDAQNNLIEGSWSSRGNGQTIVFSAIGDCGDSGLDDCFSPNTSFVLDFTGANGNVESTDGKKLVCAPTPSTNKCLPIDFTTGSGVDRNAPTVKIFEPGTVGQGDSPEIEIEVVDDIAVQNVSLYVAGKLVGSQSFEGCQQNVTTKIVWNTASLQPGQLYTLVAEGLDQSAQAGNDSIDVRLLPAHCFNNVLDSGEEQIGPPACGGDCGSCAGGSCQYNHQCAGGLLCVQGACTKIMRILGIDPKIGAPKNYMGIFGENFGATPGSVWFSKVAQPNKDTAAHWTEAQVVNCGTDTKNWFNDQIVVEVPEDFNKDQVGAAIMVSGNGFVANTIGDGTDVYSRNLRFKYDGALANRPSLCMVNPNQFSSFQNNIKYVGKEFGVYNSNIDRVYLNVSNDEEDKLMMAVNTWGVVSGLSQIQTQAPRLENGSLATYVLAGNVKSNSLRVRVNNTYDSTAPIVDNISPKNGAKGEYLTITGNNFGSQRGSVRFYKKPVSSLVNNSQYFEGSFDFMDECLNDIWSDKKIVVKIPQVISLSPDIGDYAVVVFNSKGQNSILQNNASFKLENTTPKPGICKIKPASGPVNSGVDIFGENFGNNKNNLKIYFWKNGAVMSSLENRASTTPQTLSNIKGGQQLTGLVPFDAMSGELLVGRIDLQNIFSNPLNFTVKDCTKPGEACATGEKCCSGGDEKGVCKPVNELCSGEIRSTGYMWRFTTKTFPKTPKVIERCSPDDSTVPTPAPNVFLNKEAESTCLTADITIEIDANININTVNQNNLIVYKCAEGPAQSGDNFCKTLAGASSLVRTSENIDDKFLFTGSLSSNNKWESNTWYQVVLTKDIRSDDSERPQSLLSNKPCANVNNSAYCFVFKTGDKDCVLSKVVVYPLNYLTKILEAPVLNRKNKNNLDEVAPPFYFKGTGIGDHCIAMNMGGYSWDWQARNSSYAEVFGLKTNPTSSVLSKANTVGVAGLPQNAAVFEARASKGNISQSGNGNLIIDLTNPEIVDYAPSCLDACPNAQVFAKFSLAMSNNFTPGSVKLLKCEDGADCTVTSTVSTNFQFSSESNYRDLVLNLTTDLNTNTYYIVSITSGTLFSAGLLSDNLVVGSPFRQNFSWRFRTKDKNCVVDRIDVLPKSFNSYFVGEKKIYKSDVYSSPDGCSVKGQKLKSTDYNWSWSSQYPQIAAAVAYKITGQNPYCTVSCLKRGSVIALNQLNYNYPLCGNGKIEAGEDCDPPNLYSEGGQCGLNCLFINKSKTGSLTQDKINPEDTNAPVCGDGQVSAQEDCDTSIAPSSTQNVSSMFCSKNCLHTGTALSSAWCRDNYDSHYDKPGFKEKCAFAMSQCGNGILEPDEDCDSGANCNNNCFFVDKNKRGSSLFDNPPSVCGDGVSASTEDAYCETQLFGNNNFISPWALVTAIGEYFQEETPLQKTQIRAAMIGSGNKTGVGEFNLICGYKTDDECANKKPATETASYGVGKNSCCYPRPRIVTKYPENGNICPNTVIKVTFDRPIDVDSLSGNLLLAREYGEDDSFCNPANDVTSLIASLTQNTDLPWYKKIWLATVNFFSKILFIDKATAKWCVGETEGTPRVDYNATNNTFELSVDLKNPLKGNKTTYKILLLKGIKDDKGVSIGEQSLNKPHQFSFTTWDLPDVCKISYVELEPKTVLFTKANSSTVLVASPKTDNLQLIQSTDSYAWDYVWSKDNSGSFRINNQSKAQTSVVTSNNQNGEGEVFVTVSTTAKETVPPGKSKITVFLCENPWPPFEVKNILEQTIKVWPFEDKQGNKDYFNFNYNPETTETGFTGADYTKEPYTNFSIYYCADAGVIGKKDDLPYFKPVVSSTPGALKYFLLTNDKNADAIGIKIFSNNEYYLTLAEWLNNNETTRRGSYNTLKIDGYDAAVDQTGNNVYIAALNYNWSGDPDDSGIIYSNIYLFSLSANASAESKRVFDQMLTNLKFNINLNPNYNVKMCASGYGDSSPVGYCNTDLDCLGVLNKKVCLNQKEKVQRNYQRLQDARFVSSSLAEYFVLSEGIYPSVNQSYLPNRAMSIWQSSWVELGSKLGKTLPLDPINKLAPGGTCFLEKNKFCAQNFDCGSVPDLAGQVGYWAGENNFKDSSSRVNDATGQGVNFAPGAGRDFAFNFPTGFEKITIKHQDEYNIDLDNFAISFWFKPTEQTPAILIKKGGWSDTAPNNTLGGFMVEYNKLSFAGGSPIANNGTIRFAIFPTSTDSNADKQYFAIDTLNPLSLNKWHHILVRYSSSAGLMYMIVNGTEFQAVKTGSLPHSSFAKSQIKIGKNNEDIIVGEGLKGQIDEIYFYARTGMGGTEAALNSRFENICHLHDSQTGWSAEALRLSFACADKSMAYDYKLEKIDKYVWRYTKEDDGLLPGAWDIVENKFGLNIQKTFCESPIISNDTGLCGNNIVNPGEICDPPGKLEYNIDPCPTASATVKSCNSDCRGWSSATNVSCRIAVGGDCGDGIVQRKAGENCDDGENNGRLGFCGTNCQPQVSLCGNSVINNDELCDWKLDCGNDRFCFIDNDLKIKWGITREYSCFSNCKSYGPYCGNGKWESEYEDCDGNQSCMFTLEDGRKISGTKYCSPECQADNSKINGLISFWNFNIREGAVPGVYQFKDGKDNNPALCGVYGSVCPVEVDGRNNRNKGLDFSQNAKAALVVYETNEPNKRLLKDEMSIELWIKPYAGNLSAARILEKGGHQSNPRGGYGIEFNPTYQQTTRDTLRWIIWNPGSTMKLDTPGFKEEDFNKWHHIVVTYKKIDATQSQIQLFLNGELTGSATNPGVMTETNYPLCIGAKCVKSGSSYAISNSSNFKGLVDDLAFYDRVLSTTEIKSHYEGNSWYCSPFSESEIDESTCGDGELTKREIEVLDYKCDNGSLNGVACTIPTGYPNCSYCSSDCKQIRWNSCAFGYLADQNNYCPGIFWWPGIYVQPPSLP